MSQILITLFTVGWADFFSPTGIAMLMLIASMVEKKWHSMLYIIANHVAYLIAACAVYFGVNRYLKGFYLDICERFPKEVAITKLVIAAIAIIGAIFMTIYLIRMAIKRRPLTFNSMLHIRSVSPWFLVAFSFGYTFSNIFYCYPLFGFIAVLTSANLPFFNVFLWLCGFCMFSTTPKLCVYFLLYHVKGKNVTKILDIITKIMTAVCFYLIPVLLAALAWWALKTGVPVLR